MRFDRSGRGHRRRGSSTRWVKPDALRYSGDSVAIHGDRLQAFLNQFSGVQLEEDGRLGPRSSDAFRLVTGYFLMGDPRVRTPDHTDVDDGDLDHILGV